MVETKACASAPAAGGDTAALAFLGALDPAAAQDKKTLRVVMHSGLRVTDPIITTAISRATTAS